MALFRNKKKQQQQFDQMYKALRLIGRGTYPVQVLRNISEERYGILPDVAVREGYTNMQQIAKEAIRGIVPHNPKHLDD